jgi:hypothetical protein
MSRSRHTEAQIIAALKQVEAGRTVKTWRVSRVVAEPGVPRSIQKAEAAGACRVVL